MYIRKETNYGCCTNRKAERLYLHKHKRMSFRHFNMLSIVVNFQLIVALCLPFSGLVRGAHLQSRATPISHAPHGPVLSRAALAQGHCCSAARHKPSLARRNFVAKMPLKKVAAHHAPCCVSVPQAISTAKPPSGESTANWFPYPSCTWWADQRFYQLHGIYVPWHTQADAWQWTARAYQLGWHVSTQASVGAIIDLQPWVQGAYGLGHVAVVEQVLSNGSVIASNMNWGGYPYQVTYVEFSPGPGVTFIT